MSSYLLNTKLLASCLKCGRVVSATPYYTLWDKTTPSHINSSFLEQYCYVHIFRPFCLLSVPIRTQFWQEISHHLVKNADVSIDTTVFEVRIEKKKKTSHM